MFLSRAGIAVLLCPFVAQIATSLSLRAQSQNRAKEAGAGQDSSGFPLPGRDVKPPKPDPRSVEELMKVVKSDKSKARERALNTLIRRGPEAGKAIPLLIELLNASPNDVVMTAGTVLAAIGKEAVPHLVESLGAANAAVRAEAVRALTRMGDERRSAVPALIKLLKDPNVTVRRETLHCFGCQLDKSTIPEIIKVIQNDPDNVTRYRACETIAYFGKAAEAAIPSVEAFMRDFHAQRPLGYLIPRFHSA